MAVFQIEGEELIEKEVGDAGGSGRIYIKKKYIGQNVKIIISKVIAVTEVGVADAEK